MKLQAKMAQCTTPLSPENLPGPSGHASGLSQVEQEKEKSPQDSSSGLYQSSNEEFIDNSGNFMESSSSYEVAGGQLYEDSESDDGLDVVYGPNPAPGSRILQRPLYNQDCPSNNTSSICPRQPTSSRDWNHEGEHYSYFPTYSRVSRVHPQDYYQYDQPSFRPSRFILRDWSGPAQSSQRESSSRYNDPHDPYDLGYPTILRHPNRHRHRRQHLEPVTPRIPYHARPPVEIDMDYLDYDQVPPTTMPETIRRSNQDPDLDIAGIRNIRHDQQRQVIMRNASTSTPPIPSLRQYGNTSSMQVNNTVDRKRVSQGETDTAVPAKKVKQTEAEVPTPNVADDQNDEHALDVVHENETRAPRQQVAEVSEELPPSSEEENANFLICRESLPEELGETVEVQTDDASVSEVENQSPSNTTSLQDTSNETNFTENVAPATQAQSIAVPVLSHTSSVLSSTTNKSTAVKSETRTVPASEIEFVTSTLKPRSKPGSTQTSRKTSPNTSRASPVHVAAYSQEALRDLVCATLAPAAAANLIKSEKRDKKSKETTRTTPDPINDPQPGPSGLQSTSSDIDRPGPSGLQPQASSSGNDLQADDLQLDCLSSDTEGSSNEDVQVVKISRRIKFKKKPVEVDLTQDMTSDDDGDVVIEEVRSRPVSEPSQPASTSNSDSSDNKPEINVKTFASVPDNVTNIQSSGRGSASSSRESTPAASSHDHPYGSMSSYLQNSGLNAEGSWSANGGPPPYQHRDHGYVRHPDSIAGIRQLPDITQQHNSATEEMHNIETEDRNDAIMDPVMNDMMLGFRPRRLRHPWHHEEPRRCEHRNQPCPPMSCPCTGRHRSQTNHTAGVHGQHHHGAHHYTNPPPAHRASMYPSTNSDYSRLSMPGSRPGSLLRAVQRMNPRHQRLYQLQQQTTEQLRRWSVRAPPPPYPATSTNTTTVESNNENPSTSSSSSCSETPQANQPLQAHLNISSAAANPEQVPATATSNQQDAPQHRPMLSVPRVIMTSRPTLQIPQSGASLLLPRTYEHSRSSNAHNLYANQQPAASSQNVPPLTSRGPMQDPPPAHQPPPPRFPEEVQLLDSRRARRCPRWHIPVMGDPHAPYPHPEVEPVPLDMHTNPMYHPPPYHHNMILNAHHGNNGPVMVDPRDPLMVPAGVPQGRDNPEYMGPGHGMFNILFQPHRMGSFEVNYLT